MAVALADGGGGIRVLTLVGVDRSGFLNTDGLIRMAAVLQEVGADPAVRALVLRGNDGMFCRGRIGAKGLTRASDVAEDLGAILQVNTALDALSVPVICAIEGEALGFGFGLAAQSDYAVAAEDAVLALPEMSHGLPPLIVLSYLTRFVPYKRAFDLAVTSRRIGATEAKEAGVVTEIVPSGQAVARAMAVAQGMTAHDARSVALLRRFARHAAGAHNQHLSEHAVSLMSVLLAERAQDALQNAAA
jgi:enoyl-CoA hydratase/carnithine racemase